MQRNAGLSLGWADYVPVRNTCQADVKQADLVGLLRGGVDAAGGRWADLGAGEGAFTFALSELLGPTAPHHRSGQGRASPAGG